MASGSNELTSRAVKALAAGLALLIGASPTPGRTASFLASDLQVLGRAIAFMQPPPSSDAVIAIAYLPGSAESKRDADAIAALIGEGLKAGRAVLRAKVVDLNGLEAGGFRIVIAAAGANGARLDAAARTMRALCVTTDIEAVRAGLCAMAITSTPRVEIIVNHAVSAAEGVEFVAAFRMMIQEL